MPFTIASKNIKYLVLSLKKYMQKVYREKCKTLLRKTEENLKVFLIFMN